MLQINNKIMVASDFVTVIFSQSDNKTDGILKTEKTEQAYLPTVLCYCVIQIKALTKNSSLLTIPLSPELSCPNPHFVLKSS